MENNDILDLSPTIGQANTYDFRARQKSLEIQPGMRFAGRSHSEVKLPSVTEKK